MKTKNHFSSLAVTLVSFVVLSSAIPQIAHANDVKCEKAAKAAAKAGVHHLVLSMEGLMGGTDGRAASYARSILGDSGEIAQVMPFSWTQSSSAASCAKIWKQIHGKNLRLTFIGHSFGGGRGGMSAVKKMSQAGIVIQDLIVFDGRIGNELRCGQNGGQQFQRPSNVERVTNFFQCGGMPGRTFTEETGRVANYELTGSSHINLPSHPDARDVGAAVIRRNEFTQVTPSSALIATPSNKQLHVATHAPTKDRSDRPAKCERNGIFYDCTYKEATQRSYRMPVR